MAPDGVVESVGVVVAVAAVVVVSGALAVTTFGDGGPTVDADTDADTSGPPAEYRPASVVADRIPATGHIRIDPSVHANTTERKVVVIDDASRIRQEDVRPLIQALTLAGHEVRYASGDVNESLRSADAYVLIDPGQSMDRGEIAGVQNFTDSGGRVLLVAEPNRIAVSASAFSASLTTERTAVVELAAAYGVVFGNRYLYDTTTNDGNYKNVLARPTDATDAPDLDQVALYTATRIESRNGTVLLRTPPSTRLSNEGAAGEYPVAVRTGNLLALGDGTFLHESRHTVADNEAFVGYVVEFLVRGDRDPPANGTTGEEATPTATETPTVTPAGSSTSAPSTPEGTSTPDTTPEPTPTRTPTATPGPVARSVR